MAGDRPAASPGGLREAGGAALTVEVRLATGLRMHADGAARLTVEVPEPAILADVVEALAVAYPAVGRRVRDETGAVRRHVNLFVGSDNARDLEGLDTPVPEGTEVSVLAAVSGG